MLARGIPEITGNISVAVNVQVPEKGDINSIGMGAVGLHSKKHIQQLNNQGED